ncbi:FERM domain-containing protein 8-like isoform X2 [Anneissia japonica]|nr:FERM domain-containing protein 8-like isoform X2 [Anneissia japonica]XP_033095333.1 FERM domain-containing protein 8-like isoform X2 [Anneissia japonica]
MATAVRRFHLQPTSTDDSIASNFTHPMRMTSTSSSLNRPVEVCIFLKTGNVYEFTLDSGGMVTAAALQEMMLETLDLSEAADEIFYIWLISPLLKLQLKPNHIPLKLCRQWHELLQKFTNATNEQIAADEPCVYFLRNAFYPKQKELQLTDDKILRLLFYEARENVLEGVYGCEKDEYEYLAGILAYIEHGRFDPKKHTPIFLSLSIENLLPPRLCRQRSRKVSPRASQKVSKTFDVETRVLSHWQKVSTIVKCKADCNKSFLEFLWKMPIYGSVFFTGEIEEPNTSKSIVGHSYKLVYVGINRDGVYLVDLRKQELLLGLLYDDLSWEYTERDQNGEASVPCLWLEFDAMESGKKVSKLLRIFSKQAPMMNGMIHACIEELNNQDKESLAPPPYDTVDGCDLGVVEGPCTGIERLNDKDFKEIPLDDDDDNDEEIKDDNLEENRKEIIENELRAHTTKVRLSSAPPCFQRTRATTVQSRPPHRLGLDTVDGAGITRAKSLDGRNRAYMTLPARKPKVTLCKKMDKLCLSTFSETGDMITRKPKLSRPFSMTGIFHKS